MSKEDEEIEGMMAEMVAADQSLTQEQRNEVGRAMRLHALVKALDRTKKLIELDSPDCIIASAIRIIYRRSWSLWEKDMAREEAKERTREMRRGSARCLKCGNDLPLPYTEEDHCPTCVAEQEKFDREVEADERESA